MSPRSPRAAASATDAPRPGGRGGPVWRRARAVGLGALVTLVLLVAASVAGLLPLQIMRVDSGSMAPTIEAGDLLLVDHRRGPVHRGDVVAVENPAGGGLLVKRVVGLGGDEVGIEDGVLVVNGAPVCEPAIDPMLIDGVYFGPVTVPPGELFLLSDHRDRSIDSRIFGTVPASELVGFVQSRLWPSPGGLPTTGSC